MTTRPEADDSRDRPDQPVGQIEGEQPPDAEGEQSPEEEPLPSFSEQMAFQLGGVRGLVESSIPVLLFVVLNFIASHGDLWKLRTTVIASVASALALAGYRLTRRQPVRHAVNGVFGVLLGAYFAMRTGKASDFYLPGIIQAGVLGCAMLVSVVVNRPLAGWLWAVMFDGGSGRWYKHPALLRAFRWITTLWATTYLLKVVLQEWLRRAGEADWLGATRLFLGWPPYALLLALTVWSAKRILRREGEPEAGQQVSAGTTAAN